MLWALKYRDWLHRILRRPDGIPMIEKRDGEPVLRISTQMPETLRANLPGDSEMTSHE
jgi:hypothetical protein